MILWHYVTQRRSLSCYSGLPGTPADLLRNMQDGKETSIQVKQSLT
jgi:hypothetical protein